MLITFDLVRGVWSACYAVSRLRSLYDKPCTPEEVLTRKDGEWADVPSKDRIWTIMHRDVVSDKVIRLFAAKAAERALQWTKDRGQKTDDRSWAAVKAVRDFCAALISREELLVARKAASAAAAATDPAAAVAAAVAASAAAAATDPAAAAAAAAVAAVAAAAAAEREKLQDQLVEDLLQIIKENPEV